MWLPSSFPTRRLAFLPAFQLSYPPSSFPTRQTAFLPTFQLSYPSNSFPTLPWLPSSFPTRLPPSDRLPTRRTAFLRLAAAFQLPTRLLDFLPAK